MLYVDEQEMLLSAKYISELGEKTIYFGHLETKTKSKVGKIKVWKRMMYKH